MAALADYAHARNLKFGLYSSNSPNTCDGRPGSYNYETLDAQTYASWGVSSSATLQPPVQPAAYLPPARHARRSTC